MIYGFHSVAAFFELPKHERISVDISENVLKVCSGHEIRIRVMPDEGAVFLMSGINNTFDQGLGYSEYVRNFKCTGNKAHLLWVLWYMQESQFECKELADEILATMSAHEITEAQQTYKDRKIEYKIP